MRYFLKEPLLHFTLLGALLFSVYVWLDDTAPEQGEEVIHLTQQDVNWLRQSWERQRLRPPTDEELQGLLADYLREELLAREAIAMGLQEGDTIVRRRLAQKLEFMIQDTALLAAPDESTLESHYQQHLERYRTPERITFSHRQYATEASARAGLASNPLSPLGERSLLEPEYVGESPQAVASVFGEAFSASLFALKSGSWQGPVVSAYGYHLVYISAREPGQVRPFGEVRDLVLVDWQGVQQDEAKAQFLAALMDKYEVVADGELAAAVQAVRKGQLP